MAAKNAVVGTDLVTAVVAERKTVMVDGKYVGPGGEVTLPSDEVIELRALGFLVDPASAVATPVGDGPTFEVDAGGPSITPAA